MGWSNKFVLSFFLETTNTLSEGADPYRRIDWDSPEGQRFVEDLNAMYEQRLKEKREKQLSNIKSSFDLKSVEPALTVESLKDANKETLKTFAS